MAKLCIMAITSAVMIGGEMKLPDDEVTVTEPEARNLSNRGKASFVGYVDSLFPDDFDASELDADDAAADDGDGGADGTDDAADAAADADA